MDIKTLSDSDLYALMTDIQNELRHRTEVQAATSLIGVLQANQYTAAFAPLAKALAENEETIVSELNGVQGDSVDIGGYYYPDPEKVTSVMRPSKTFNEALESAHG